MTIVFLCPSFYPKIGGVEKHAFEVAKRLKNKGHKIIVITESARNKKEIVNGIEVYRYYFGEKNFFKKFKIWIRLWGKRKILEKADIIHCHDVFFWYLPFRFLYLRKKVFTTFHGYETKFPPTWKAIFIRKLSERLSLGNICIGDYIKKWYSTKPTFISYGAHDEVNSRLRINVLKNKKINILFVGRLEKDTGIKIYSEGLSLLNKSNFKLEACGDGSLRKELEKFGKINGFVRNLNPYLAKADMVFASSYLSILTAMFSKKPVIAVYDNPLKKDYLKMSPFAKYIKIVDSPKKVADELKSMSISSYKINYAYEWARKQTWTEVTNLYLRLFGI